MIKRSKQNRGFSLIEIIIVVALLGLFIAITAASLSLIFSTQASKCANDMNNLIAKCKMNSMSRQGNVCVEFIKEGSNIEGRYYENGHLISTEIVGNSRIAVSFTDTNGAEYQLGNQPLYISFNRSTASLKTLLESSQIVKRDDVFLFAPNVHCREISIKSNNKNYTIEIVPSTGKHYIS